MLRPNGSHLIGGGRPENVLVRLIHDDLTAACIEFERHVGEAMEAFADAGTLLRTHEEQCEATTASAQ
jgi:hypothetical protein